MHPVFKMRGHKPGEAPVMERIWFKEQVALPLSPAWDNKKVDEVLERVAKAREMVLSRRR